jgi:uncharacterized protein YjbI with pentapeptide repeats
LTNQFLQGDVSIQRDEEGCVFLDRDAKYFKYILNWLRTGTWPKFYNDYDRKMLIAEARYFGLIKLVEILSSVKKESGNDQSSLQKSGSVQTKESKASTTTTPSRDRLYPPEFLQLLHAYPGKNLRLNGVDMRSIVLKCQDLQGISFIASNLSGMDLHQANFKGCNFEEANLSQSNLQKCILSKANFIGADLSLTDLSFANLSDTDFTNADLRGANLSRCNLANANLTNANLVDAVLEKADIKGTNFTKANLSGTKMMGCSSLNEANFKDTKGRFVV